VQLGTPIGTPEFVAKHVRKKLGLAMQQMRLLPQLRNMQIAMRLLELTFLPRTRFLMSTLPGWHEMPLVAAEFAAWDACVNEVLFNLFKQTPSARIRWPWAAGGLGFFRTRDLHAEVFLRGQDRASRVARTHFPSVTRLLQNPDAPFARRLQSARSCLPLAAREAYPAAAELFSLNDSEARSAGNALKSAVAQNLIDTDKERMSDVEKRLAALSAARGASAGFTVTPRFAESRLADADFRNAACIYLGMRPTSLLGYTLPDALGRSVLSTKTAARTATHDAQVAALAGFCRAAGRSTEMEVVGLFGPYPDQREGAANAKRGENRRMDIVTATPATGARSLVDYTRPDCAAPSRMNTADPFKPLADAEKKKNAKYADKPPGFSFTTFAQGTQGELGREADALLLRLAHEAACKQSGSDTPPPRLQASLHWSFLQKLGITLMRMQAWQIADYVLTDFHTTVARGEAAHLLWSMQHAADPARRGAAGRSAMAPSVGRTPPGGRRGPRRA
jgi:hypothetical protein